MKRDTSVHAFFILMLLSLFLGGCEKKEQREHTTAPIQQTESTFHKTSDQNQTHIKEDAAAISSAIQQTVSIHYETSDQSAISLQEEEFILTDLTGEYRYVSVKNSKLTFKNISQPIVILYFFAPWSLPCKGEVPYLSDLQKTYSKELFIMGVLINPRKYKQQIGTFIQEQHANFYIASGKQNNRFTRKVLTPLHIANPIPLPFIVVYHHGHYWRHYEGAVPVEMLEHDIKTLLH